MISVIVPVYNEENGIINTLDNIKNALEGFVDYEIILMNDGSTDGTLDKLKGYDSKNLTIGNHVENLGYGKSLYDGILMAKHNCIAIIDGDGSYPAESIKELYKYYPQYDMIVGARTGKEYKKGLLKGTARIVFKYLVEYASGRKVPDVNSGLRIFKKDIIMKFADSLCTGFSFTTTLTLIFFLNHYFIKYVSIKYMKREGKSKVRHLKDSLRAGQIIVEAILNYNPIKLFLLIATWNSLFGLILGIANYYFFKSNFIMIFSSILAASFIPVFSMGLLAGQFRKIAQIIKE